MTRANIIKYLRERKDNRVKVGFTDLDGVLRTKYLHRKKVLAGLEGGSGFCNVVFAWDVADRLYESVPLDAGYGDARLEYDAATYRIIPWEADCPLLLGDFSEATGAPSHACPRSLLKRVVTRAGELGYTAGFGPEYEWMLYRETPETLRTKNFRELDQVSGGMFGYSGLRTGQFSDFHHQLFNQLEQFGVTLEGVHTETGPGMLEAAIAYQPALEAADRAVLFKEGVKQLAHRHCFTASFMAKPSAALPGCGGHLHQSLWRDGNNEFYDAEDAHGMSATFRHYLAGQLHFLPALLALFAPTVNSYKRLVPGSWAATRACWGVDNRTVALRVVPGTAASTRLETRVPGADANPYLAIAAALAAGLYGVEHKLMLDAPPVVGSAYDQTAGAPLAGDLGAAAGAMAGCEELGDLLGEAFVRHYVMTRREEWEQYRRAVTDWETRRYLEII